MNRVEGPERRRNAAPDERPTHPTGPAILLLIGVTLLIVALAASSAFGLL